MDEFARLRTGWAFIISLAVFTAVQAVLALPGMSKGRIVDSGWQTLEDGRWRPETLPNVGVVKKGRPDGRVLRVRIAAEPGDWIYVPRPRAQYLKITWKGRKILEASDPDAPSGNLWNRIHAVELGEPGEGELVITLAAQRTIGLPRAPFLSAKKGTRRRISFANCVTGEFFYVAMGTLVSLGILLLMRATRRREGLSAGALLGAACITGFLYLIDFCYFEDLGSVAFFFWEKKLTVASGYLSALCYALGAEKFLTGGFKRTKFLAIPTAVSVFGLLVAWNQYVYWNAVNFFNLVLLCNLAFLVFILLREDRRGLGLHLPGFFLGFSIIQLLIVLLFNLPLPLVVQYAVVVDGVFLGLVTALHPAESERSGNPSSGASVRDSLTGLPDRFWMARVHMRGPGSVAAVCIKGFREMVADQGQSAGDRAVLSLAGILKDRLRRSDIILRMEVDVFVVMMEAVEEEGALKAMARVAEDFSKKDPNPALRLCYSIGPMGSNAADSAEEAVRRLAQGEGSPQGAAFPQAT